MHYSDAEVKDLVARGTPVVKGLSSDDDDLYDEGQDHLKVLTEFAELDGDTLPNTPKTERWRSQRDESAAWLEALIEQAPGPESQFGPVVRTREYTDERGRYTKDFFDSEGNLVDRQQLSRAETDEKAADIKAIVDTRENVRWIREQAQNKRALANDADRTGSANVAATLREEADALDADADSKMVSLRKVVTPEDWRSYGLGNYDPVAAKVKPTVEALAAGKLDDALAAFHEMNPVERMTFWEGAMGLRDGAQLLDAMTQRLEDQEVPSR